MASQNSATAGSDRKKMDAAALLAINALEEGHAVADILKLYAEAGLIIPSAVASHTAADLQRMIMAVGVGAAKHIEASMNSNSKAPALAADKGFQQYMALRLQLFEGTQLSNEISASDGLLRAAFTSFISSAIQFSRYLADGSPAPGSSSSAVGVGQQSTAVSRLRDTARKALVLAAKEMESAAQMVASYGGVNVDIACVPTPAFINDAYLDAIEGDSPSAVGAAGRQAGDAPPPCLAAVTFGVSDYISDNRSARLVISSVRKAVSGARKRVSEGRSAVEAFAQGVVCVMTGLPSALATSTRGLGLTSTAAGASAAAAGAATGRSASPSAAGAAASARPSTSADSSNNNNNSGGVVDATILANTASQSRSDRSKRRDNMVLVRSLSPSSALGSSSRRLHRERSAPAADAVGAGAATVSGLARSRSPSLLPGIAGNVNGGEATAPAAAAGVGNANTRYDAAVAAEEERGMLVSPAAKLQFSSVARDKGPTRYDGKGYMSQMLDVKRGEMKEYLNKRKEARLTVSSIGGGGGRSSSAAAASSSSSSAGPGVSSSSKAHSSLSSVLSLVQQVSESIAAGNGLAVPPDHDDAPNGTAAASSSSGVSSMQLNQLAQSLQSLSVSLAAQVKSAAAATAASAKGSSSSSTARVNARRSLSSSSASATTAASASSMLKATAVVASKALASSAGIQLLASPPAAGPRSGSVAAAAAAAAAAAGGARGHGGDDDASGPLSASQLLSSSRSLSSIGAGGSSSGLPLSRRSTSRRAMSVLLESALENHHDTIVAPAAADGIATISSPALRRARSHERTQGRESLIVQSRSASRVRAGAVAGGDVDSTLRSTSPARAGSAVTAAMDFDAPGGDGEDVSALPVGQRVLAMAYALANVGAPIVPETTTTSGGDGNDLDASVSSSSFFTKSGRNSKSLMPKASAARSASKSPSRLAATSATAGAAAGASASSSALVPELPLSKPSSLPPNQRPPTSRSMGKGEEIWRKVWADGVALADASLLVGRNNAAGTGSGSAKGSVSANSRGGAGSDTDGPQQEASLQRKHSVPGFAPSSAAHHHHHNNNQQHNHHHDDNSTNSSFLGGSGGASLLSPPSTTLDATAYSPPRAGHRTLSASSSRHSLASPGSARPSVSAAAGGNGGAGPLSFSSSSVSRTASFGRATLQAALYGLASTAGVLDLTAAGTPHTSGLPSLQPLPSATSTTMTSLSPSRYTNSAMSARSARSVSSSASRRQLQLQHTHSGSVSGARSVSPSVLSMSASEVMAATVTGALPANGLVGSADASVSRSTAAREEVAGYNARYAGRESRREERQAMVSAGVEERAHRRSLSREVASPSRSNSTNSGNNNNGDGDDGFGDSILRRSKSIHAAEQAFNSANNNGALLSGASTQAFGASIASSSSFVHSGINGSSSSSGSRVVDPRAADLSQSMTAMLMAYATGSTPHHNYNSSGIEHGLPLPTIYSRPASPTGKLAGGSGTPPPSRSPPIPPSSGSASSSAAAAGAAAPSSSSAGAAVASPVPVMRVDLLGSSSNHSHHQHQKQDRGRSASSSSSTASSTVSPSRSPAMRTVATAADKATHGGSSNGTGELAMSMLASSSSSAAAAVTPAAPVSFVSPRKMILQKMLRGQLAPSSPAASAAIRSALLLSSSSASTAASTPSGTKKRPAHTPSTSSSAAAVAAAVASSSSLASLLAIANAPVPMLASPPRAPHLQAAATSPAAAAAATASITVAPAVSTLPTLPPSPRAAGAGSAGPVNASSSSSSSAAGGSGRAGHGTPTRKPAVPSQTPGRTGTAKASSSATAAAAAAASTSAAAASSSSSSVSGGSSSARKQGAPTNSARKGVMASQAVHTATEVTPAFLASVAAGGYTSGGGGALDVSEHIRQLAAAPLPGQH